MRAEATTEKLATSLMLIVAQILEGNATCTYCEREARLTICTGADPEPDPVCAEHARRFIGSTDSFIEQVFGG